MRALRCVAAAFGAVLFGALVVGCAQQAAAALPKLKIDATRVTVAGLSSGAYMATQAHLAWPEAFASADETAALRQQFADGIAWGDAKQVLFERVDSVVAPMRAQYETLISNPARIEQTLLAGAERARALATPFLRELRAAVGLRALGGAASHASKEAKAVKSGKTATFKQYREKDGKFYFKLVAADGRVLLQSTALDAPRDAGQAIARLQQGGAAALAEHAALLQYGEGVEESEVLAALQALADGAAP